MYKIQKNGNIHGRKCKVSLTLKKCEDLKENSMMKTVLKTAAFFLCAAILAGVISLPMAETTYGGIYEKTVRLHVLANSDTEEDQRLKLLLRDELLSYLTPILQEASNKENAEKLIKDNLPEIEAFSRAFLESQHSDDMVSVVLGKEFYPTRTYENCSYPAGEYTSLRVFIGSGQGHNWWCVVYPPLCLAAADAGKELENSCYTADEKALLLQEEGGYKVRFALLDFAAKLKKLFG